MVILVMLVNGIRGFLCVLLLMDAAINLGAQVYVLIFHLKSVHFLDTDNTGYFLHEVTTCACAVLHYSAYYS